MAMAASLANRPLQPEGLGCCSRGQRPRKAMREKRSEAPRGASPLGETIAHCALRIVKRDSCVAPLGLAELFAGAYKRQGSTKLLTGIADLLTEVAVLDFDTNCAEQ